MASQANQPADDGVSNGDAGPDHDAFVREKVKRGLEQSRDRAAMRSVEQVWRDLSR